MRRFVVATLAGLTVFGLVNGLAASMPVTGTSLGSGQGVTAACDPDGITMAFGVSPGSVSEVTEVTFSGVAGTCDGLTVYLDVLDAGDSSVRGSETDTVALSSGSFTVMLTTPLPAAEVGGANVTITG